MLKRAHIKEILWKSRLNIGRLPLLCLNRVFQSAENASTLHGIYGLLVLGVSQHGGIRTVRHGSSGHQSRTCQSSKELELELQ